MEPPFLIAEIGCNHCGDFDHAKKLIDVAHTFCQAPCVKFQKRTNEEVLTPDEFSAPHPNPHNSYGDTYGAHRAFLEFTLEQHAALKEYCDAQGVIYSASVWDMTSAKEIAGLEPALIKIPSACNTHYEMAEYLCSHYAGEIHVSLGMTTAKEVDEIIAFYRDHDRLQDVVLYHCTSGYPIQFEEANLLEITRLRDKVGGEVKGIGYSGHHRGIAIDIAAYALGASYIERHFTLDRTQKGTDHAASLEPDGLRRVSRDLTAAHAALRHKPQDILEVETPQRAKLKWDRNQ